jgi:hypothetical protein
MSNLSNKSSDLENAIASLDDRNAGHWTVEGTPRLGVIQSLTRNPSVTRADVDAIGRIRQMVSAPVELSPLTPEQAAINADHAEAARLTASEVLAASKVELRRLRGVLADAILIWQGFTPRLTVSDLVRQNSLRERTRRLAEINGTVPIDEAPRVESPSHLDNILSGNRGSANRGYKRPYPGLPLGSRVAVPKLPSDR